MAGVGRGSNHIFRDLPPGIPLGIGELSGLTQALLEPEGVKGCFWLNLLAIVDLRPCQKV